MRNNGIFDFMGQRALTNPMSDVQMGIDPVLTDIVLGTPQVAAYPGSQILRPITAPAFTFSYNSFGNERFEAIDTERAMRAPIKHGEFRATQETGRLKRFSFGTLRDQDELSNAHPSYGLMEKCAAYSRSIVETDIERRRRDLLVTAANYDTGNTLAIGAGSEWDAAGGDSKADVTAMVNMIASKTGLQPSQLEVFLGFEALQAAKMDPVFNAVRGNYDANMPTVGALQAYWGTGRVWSANPIDVTNGVVSFMYGDVAIIYYPGDASLYDTSWGDLTFGVDFTWNRGVASKPFYLDQHTSWFFPWTNYSNPAIINNTAGALITNCAA